jgi:hypothetical protein
MSERAMRVVRVMTEEVMEVLLAVLVGLQMRERAAAGDLFIASLRRGLEAQSTILKRLETQRARDSRAMLANLHQITRQPVVRNVATAEAAEDADNDNGDAQRQIIFAATLSANPRSLHVLWEEYKRGTGGRRAARLFTRDERGRVKHKYHRRKKMVWD